MAVSKAVDRCYTWMTVIKSTIKNKSVEHIVNIDKLSSFFLQKGFTTKGIEWEGERSEKFTHNF